MPMKEKAIAPESLLLMGRSKLADYITLTKFRLQDYHWKFWSHREVEIDRREYTNGHG